MSDVSVIATKLKALRKEAGLSIRAIADELGVPSSGYAHYELRYKRPFLPMALAQNLAEVLSRRGVSKHRVLALAGAEGNSEPPGFAGGAMTIVDGEDLVPVYNVAAVLNFRTVCAFCA